MRKVLKFTTPLILCASLFGCGGGSGSSDIVSDLAGDDLGDEVGDELDGVNVDDLIPPAEIGSFIGMWRSDCVLLTVNGIDIYAEFSFQIVSADLVHAQNFFTDPLCSIQTVTSADNDISGLGSIIIGGSYVDSGLVTTSDGLDANNLALTIDSSNSVLSAASGELDLALGNEIDFLVFVDDSDVLFADALLLNVSTTPGNLALNIPFTRL